MVLSCQTRTSHGNSRSFPNPNKFTNENIEESEFYRILRYYFQFHSYKDLANIEETCKLFFEIVNEVGYVFYAARVAIDEVILVREKKYEE